MEVRGGPPAGLPARHSGAARGTLAAAEPPGHRRYITSHIVIYDIMEKARAIEDTLQAEALGTGSV